jgi:hypothetical protein
VGNDCSRNKQGDVWDNQSCYSEGKGSKGCRPKRFLTLKTFVLTVPYRLSILLAAW